MRTHTTSHDEHSPMSLLTELAVEGTSTLVEAQRTFLHLAQQENDIILNGIKERVGGFPRQSRSPILYAAASTPSSGRSKSC